MDEAVGFDSDDYFKSKILQLEKKLIKNSSIVFTSSKFLFKNLVKNYQCEDKLVLVRNAFDGKIINDSIEKNKSQETFKIGYFGTISNHINIESIITSLEGIKNIEYHFIGPIEYNSIDFSEYDRDKVSWNCIT